LVAGKTHGNNTHHAICRFGSWVTISATAPFSGEDQLMDAHELVTRYEAGERDFGWANLHQAELSGAVLSRAVLYHVNMSRANLKGSNLDRADLIGANLHEAILTGVNLREVNLAWADLA
jgi:uncharacterized protein YjbI with pentapeptide repeats